MRVVPVNVILPVDKLTFPGMPEREEKPYKTLYLLHGIFGNYTDWVTGTRVQRWAEENNLVVVMPSGDNAFYLDHPESYNFYGEFIGSELVDLTRKMFPLSRKREDTFIGGLSMGGFGAIRNGLKYHDTFGAIVGLSSGLILDDIANRKDDGFILTSRRYAEYCFGDLDKVNESDCNPKYLVDMLKKEKSEFPKFYIACGSEDGLLKANKDFVDYLRNADVEVTFEVGPGGHDWDFWDKYLKEAMDWLPLERSNFGINSGHIGGK